ncbi:MAG: thiamine pyrophosphate-dependent dehydrogenase E1 component subunit alpha [Dehalococcoidia bacterium]
MTDVATRIEPRQPTRDEMRGMLERMVIIRRAEEQLGVDSKAGRLNANVHSYVGQEAVAVGICSNLSEADYITSTHRGHGHYLAKGGTPREMIAEIYAKRTGACGGFGGSMHVADLSKGILGANGVVGGGISISAGAALAAQVEGAGRVAVGFFGDGAAAQGGLCEVLNIAALWRLPLVLVCENNLYVEFMKGETVTAGVIADRARPFGVPSTIVDGNDVLAVWAAAGEAIERARSGGGPTLIEARTYRTRGHVEAEAGFLPYKYRSDEEVASWTARDPIRLFTQLLQERGVLAHGEFERIDTAVAATVAEAVEFATASESPDPCMIEAVVFAGSAGTRV